MAQSFPYTYYACDCFDSTTAATSKRASQLLADASEEDDEELCIDELTVGRRKDGTGLSDATAAAEDGRDGSELRGLDGGQPVPDPVPLLLLGRAPSLDRSDGRVAMGSFRCIATQSREICQLSCRY